MATHFAALHIDDDAGGRLGAIGGHGVDQLLAEHVLHAEIERQSDRLAADGVLGADMASCGLSSMNFSMPARPLLSTLTWPTT